MSAWQTGAVVTEAKMETVDGYTIVDIEGVARLVGPVRSAKKVLQRTTIDLVRHATYACAVHGMNAVGAAAALNHDRGAEDQTPISTFAAELATWSDANNFVGSAGLGLGADEVGAALSPAAGSASEATASSAAACVPADASRIVIVSDGPEPALAFALGSADVTVEVDLSAALTSGADAVFVRGKTGTLHHEVLEGTNVGSIIGLQPLTTTARGLAVAKRHDAVVVPDFISAAGPTLAALGHSVDKIASMTSTVMATFSGSDTLFVAACEHAENHLRILTDTLPFGRPLAP